MDITEIAMDKGTAKLLAMVLLGIGSFSFGILPAFISRRNRQGIFITFSLCFGAGVLLSTAIVHMLHEVSEDLPEYAGLIFCIGFLIMYTIDDLLHLCGLSHDHPNEAQAQAQHRVRRTSPYGSVLETEQLLNGDSEERQPPYNPNVPGPSHVCIKQTSRDVEPVRIVHSSAASVVGLLCALSVHSFLEGLAIGVQDSGAKVLLLLWAVSCHKFVVGFCLGVELCKDEVSRFVKNVVQISIFALGSVTGIGIGMLLDGLEGASNLIAALQGLAGGTLLYVTLCEVIPREKSKWKKKRNSKKAQVIQLIAFILGFTVMSVLNIYISD